MVIQKDIQALDVGGWKLGEMHVSSGSTVLRYEPHDPHPLRGKGAHVDEDGGGDSSECLGFIDAVHLLTNGRGDLHGGPSCHG